MDARILFSRHATTRAQQRGIAFTHVDAVIRYFDMERFRGDGCTAIWISRKELDRLGPTTPEGVSTDKLQGLFVLLSPDQAAVTVFRNRSSNSYRRNAGS
jgi:hypothetical protein